MFRQKSDFSENEKIKIVSGSILWIPRALLGPKYHPASFYKVGNLRFLKIIKPHIFIKNIKFMTRELRPPPDLRVGDRFYIKKQNFLS